MARIFIALTPKPELNKIISALKNDQEKLLYNKAKVNWSKNNQHHITLNFIGSMEPEQKEEMFHDFDQRQSFKNLPIEIDSLSYFPNENGQVLVANISLTPRLQKLFNESSIFSIYRAFASDNQTKNLANQYQEGIAWGEAKELLFELLEEKINPFFLSFFSDHLFLKK